MAGAIDESGRGAPWRLLGWSAAAALLLVPLVAMQFTDEVDWTPFDFGFAAVLLGSVGLCLELTFRASRRTSCRLGAAIAIGVCFLLVWITGAVGIIGSEREGANLLFGGVILTALAGSALAALRARGMAVAMGAAALVQALVPLAAWGFAPPSDPAMLWEPKVLASTVVFTALWLAAAALFRRVARDEAAARR